MYIKDETIAKRLETLERTDGANICPELTTSKNKCYVIFAYSPISSKIKATFFNELNTFLGQITNLYDNTHLFLKNLKYEKNDKNFSKKTVSQSIEF